MKNKQGLLFPILDVLLNLFNWGFHIIVSWYLVPAAYGTLNSLLALLSLLMVLGVSLQFLTAQHTAAHGLEAALTLQRLAIAVAGAVAILGLCTLPFLCWLTRADAPSVSLILCIFMLNAFLSVRRGITQGQTTFLSLNISFYIEVLAKLAATFCLLHFWLTPLAALSGVAFGMLASLVFSLVSQRGQISSSKRDSLRPWLKRLGPIFGASFFLYFFSSIDMLLVNRLLPKEAGIYAVAVKYGQILFFAALSIGTVFIPHLSRARNDRQNFSGLATKLIVTLVAIDVLAILASWTLLPQTVARVFGPNYREAAPLISNAVFAYALLALCFCLVNVLVVLEEKSYLLALMGAALGLVAMLLMFHSTPLIVLNILTAVYGVLLIVLAVMTAAPLKEKKYATSLKT